MAPVHRRACNRAPRTAHGSASSSRHDHYTNDPKHHPGLRCGTHRRGGALRQHSFTNGCTLSPDGIPGFYNFRDICNQHDVCYARFSNGSHQYGTNEWGRLTCDNQFLSNMNNYCYNRFAWYDPRRNTCLSIAGTYYSAVRRLGAPFYYDYNLVY